MFQSPLPSSESRYGRLPTQDIESEGVPRSSRTSWLFKFKRKGNLRILGFVVAGFIMIAVYLVSSYGTEDINIRVSVPEPLPPLYSEYHKEELVLPQHDVDNAFAGGKKYMWVADHTQCRMNSRWIASLC